ncbi:class II SORL domain-containing protein [[Eubacterium] cellulosolvens]
MEPFGKMIYTPETASGEAISKVESHTPKIEVPESVSPGTPFEVKVSVGPHPNTVEHSIRRIEVYFYEENRAFNPVTITTANLTPAYTEPNITLTMKVTKPGTIYAVEYCNLHGLWEGRKEIKLA